MSTYPINTPRRPSSDGGRVPPPVRQSLGDGGTPARGPSQTRRSASEGGQAPPRPRIHVTPSGLEVCLDRPGMSFSGGRPGNRRNRPSPGRAPP